MTRLTTSVWVALIGLAWALTGAASAQGPHGQRGGNQRGPEGKICPECGRADGPGPRQDRQRNQEFYRDGRSGNFERQQQRDRQHQGPMAGAPGRGNQFNGNHRGSDFQGQGRFSQRPNAGPMAERLRDAIRGRVQERLQDYRRGQFAGPRSSQWGPSGPMGSRFGGYDNWAPRYGGSGGGRGQQAVPGRQWGPEQRFNQGPQGPMMGRRPGMGGPGGPGRQFGQAGPQGRGGWMDDEAGRRGEHFSQRDPRGDDRGAEYRGPRPDGDRPEAGPGKFDDRNDNDRRPDQDIERPWMRPGFQGPGDGPMMGHGQMGPRGMGRPGGPEARAADDDDKEESKDKESDENRPHPAPEGRMRR